MLHDSTAPAHRHDPPAQLARWAVLAVLIALTSLAVGATTSPWLVPPYLAAMAWLLLTPGSQTPAVAPSSPAGRAGEADDEPTTESEPVAVPEAEPTTAEAPAKPKKKARSKAKPKAPPVPEAPPMMATWVQVAPGKFVRVEVPAPAPEEILQPAVRPEAIEGPDASPEVPIESGPERDCSGLADVGSAPMQVDGPARLEHDASGSEDQAPPERMEIGPQLEPISADWTQPEVSAETPATAADEGPTTSPNLSPASESLTSVEPETFGEPDPLDDETSDVGPALSTEQESETGPPPATETPFDEAAFAGQHVAIRDGSARGPIHPRYSSARSIKLRRDPRPKPRRISGRVGATPRVVLHRS